MSKTTSPPRLAADPSPEVEPKPARRTFTAAYKAQILAECDAATEPGQIGAILRREGLYSSHLVEWRRARLAGLTPKKAGRPKKRGAERARDEELERLKRQNASLTDQLRRAEIIIEAQKKLAEVLASLPQPQKRSSG